MNKIGDICDLQWWDCAMHPSVRYIPTFPIAAVPFLVFSSRYNINKTNPFYFLFYAVKQLIALVYIQYLILYGVKYP